MMELHPLCSFFPRLDGDEYLALKADLQANGQAQPIYSLDGMILDGGNRYRACLEAGIEPRVIEYRGDDPVGFVLSQNLHRRHLKPSQSAAIVAAVQDWGRANSRGGDRKSDQSANLHFDSAESRARESGVSIRTQKSADKIAKESPDLIKRVAHGEMSLGQADALLHGKKPPKEVVVPPEDPELADCQSLTEQLGKELEAAHKEISDLEKSVGKDAAEVTREWSARYAALEGRLDLALKEKNEAIGQAKYYQRLIKEVLAAAGVADVRALINKLKGT